jgi:hypothetical protein
VVLVVVVVVVVVMRKINKFKKKLFNLKIE